jgi:anti-sigma-K factor RskA
VSSPSLEDLAMHAVHALEGGAAEEMDRLVAGSPALQAELTAMRAALAKLGGGVRQLEPPVTLEPRIVRELKVEPQSITPPSRSAPAAVLSRAPVAGSWVRPVFATVSLMALAAITVLGLRGAQLNSELQSLRAKTSQQTAILSSASRVQLASTAAGAVPIGQAFLTRDGKIVIALKLPAPETGKTYQAWFIPKGETNPRPLETFRDSLTTQIPADAAAIAVSLEPSGGSKTPTTVLGVGAVKL